jgi:hypothetical protein
MKKLHNDNQMLLKRKKMKQNQNIECQEQNIRWKGVYIKARKMEDLFHFLKMIKSLKQDKYIKR